MDSMLDLFIGDPVYDEQNNIIRRDFVIKNIVAIMVVGFIGYSLMGEMKPISGKRKMKGGGSEESPKKGFWYNHGGTMLFIYLMVWIGGGLSMAGLGGLDSPGSSPTVTQKIGLIILLGGAVVAVFGVIIA